MSPDWADKPEAVPYSQLDNPQSLNLYGYVNNNPLSKADPDGHCPECMVWGEQLLQEASESPAGQAVSNAIGVAGIAVMGFVATHASQIVDANAQAYLQGGGATTAVYVGPIMNQGTSNGSNAPAPSPNASSNTGSPSGPEGPYKNSPENNDRMKAGKAPVGNDGKAVELHHEGQDPKGPVKEMTQTDHRGGNNFKNNHPNTGQEPSKIDRNQAAQARRQHWKDKADQ